MAPDCLLFEWIDFYNGFENRLICNTIKCGHVEKFIWKEISLKSTRNEKISTKTFIIQITNFCFKLEFHEKLFGFFRDKFENIILSHFHPTSKSHEYQNRLNRNNQRLICKCQMSEINRFLHAWRNKQASWYTCRHTSGTNLTQKNSYINQYINEKKKTFQRVQNGDLCPTFGDYSSDRIDLHLVNINKINRLIYLITHIYTHFLDRINRTVSDKIKLQQLYNFRILNRSILKESTFKWSS